MFTTLRYLWKTCTSIGTQLHEHCKCQMEQVNNLTEEVTQLTSLHSVKSWLQEALMTQKILIIQILEKKMRMIGKIESLSMKQIAAFIMKSTICLIRRPHYLQWQQQVGQKMIQ